MIDEMEPDIVVKRELEPMLVVHAEGLTLEQLVSVGKHLGIVE